MDVTRRVCSLQEMCSMISFLETGNLVRALDMLEVMTKNFQSDKIFALKHRAGVLYLACYREGKSVFLYN